MTRTLPLDIVADELARLRSTNPLVHLLTNEVVQEITANVLLAGRFAGDDRGGGGGRVVCIDFRRQAGQCRHALSSAAGCHAFGGGGSQQGRRAADA